MTNDFDFFIGLLVAVGFDLLLLMIVLAFYGVLA